MKGKLIQKEDETEFRSCSQLNKQNKLEMALERTKHSSYTYFYFFCFIYLSFISFICNFL